MATHHQTVQNQFNPNADAYLTSKVHAKGEDLQLVHDYLSQQNKKIVHAIDLGCGAGHLSFSLADVVSHITAVDNAAEMLEVVRQQISDRKLDNIDTCKADICALPFEDKSIDMVCSRYSAHHWTDLNIAMKEIKRILKDDGVITMIDIQGYDNPVIDTHFQTIELLRDRSHVRNYTYQQWANYFSEIGYEIKSHTVVSTPLTFSSWVARLQTPNNKTEVIKQMQIEASSEIKATLQIAPDGSFTAQTAILCTYPKSA